MGVAYSVPGSGLDGVDFSARILYSWRIIILSLWESG